MFLRAATASLKGALRTELPYGGARLGPKALGCSAPPGHRRALCPLSWPASFSDSPAAPGPGDGETPLPGAGLGGSSRYRGWGWGRPHHQAPRRAMCMGSDLEPGAGSSHGRTSLPPHPGRRADACPPRTGWSCLYQALSDALSWATTPGAHGTG